MTKPLAKIWARRIRADAHTLDDVYDRYGNEGVMMVRTAYYDLFGEEI